MRRVFILKQKGDDNKHERINKNIVAGNNWKKLGGYKALITSLIKYILGFMKLIFLYCIIKI